MGRTKRLLYDGAVYHIISRGHNRCRIFNILDDYKAYKEIIKTYKERFNFELFHYCLMPNHIHLLLKVLKGSELPHLMQGINQAYAKHYKRSYGLIGNLFQGRYKSLHIDKDEYLLECARYIERNPLRANMVKDLSEYYFSSYNFYGKGKKDDIITTSPSYSELSDKKEQRMRLYIEYVLQPRPYEEMIDRKFKLQYNSVGCP